MLKKTLLFIALVFVITPALPQDYLVTLKRDTLYGDVNILMPEEFSEDVILSNDEDKTRYKAYQIYSAFIDSAFYQPVKWQNKYRLMKKVKSGYLGLFLFRADESFEFNSKYLLKRTSEGMEIPNISFKKHITEFLRDCPSVVAKIEDKTYKKADLDAIIDEYNECLKEKTEKKYAKTSPVTEDKKEMEVSGEDQTKIELIASIKSELTSEQSELNTLLDDIKSKVSQKQSIPGYLVSALKTQTKDLKAVQDEVSQLLALIEK